MFSLHDLLIIEQDKTAKGLCGNTMKVSNVMT